MRFYEEDTQFSALKSVNTTNCNLLSAVLAAIWRSRGDTLIYILLVVLVIVWRDRQTAMGAEKPSPQKIRHQIERHPAQHESPWSGKYSQEVPAS